MYKYNLIILAILFVGLFSSCKSKQVQTTEEETVQQVGPTFCADSAMVFCQKQCDFGPRVMNSAAHDKCGEWIISKFKEYGLEVETQKADLKGWDGTMLHSTNIIARYNPEATQRYLVCAHWDCRPWADNDPDSTNWRKPVMAANDAASGVAVMLEIARDLKVSAKDTLNSQPSSELSSPERQGSARTLNSEIGIDFVCLDAEDYGTPQWADVQDDADTWALGAQYFAKKYAEMQSATQNSQPNTQHPTPNTQWGVAPYNFGILLDMVGGQGSKFYKEGYSQHYAPSVVSKIWAASEAVGFGSFFENQDGGTITDDHKPLNDVRIPTVDIIPYYPDCEQSSFGPTWHTVSDDMQHLDASVLGAVGQTVIQTLFSE